MNDLAASIGLAQLEKLPEMNLKRSSIILRYLNGLKEIPDIMPLIPFEPHFYPYQMFGIRTNDRDELMIHLKSKGIATGCHYTPLSLQPLFKPYAYKCDYIEHEADRFITLPLHADLTDEEVDYIIEQIRIF